MKAYANRFRDYAIRGAQALGFILMLMLAITPSLCGAEGQDTSGGLFQDFSSALGFDSGQKQFLHPDEAFVLSMDHDGGRTLVARWDIAEGYYLYRDKFSFSAQEGVELGPPDLPPGEVKEDPNFGSVEVFHGPVELRIPMPIQIPTVQLFELTVGYQGCAEDGICYPPIKKQLPIQLSSISSDPIMPPKTTSVGGLSEQDSIAQTLSTGALAPILLSFFGFGLLLSFTPCVLPMIPILSGIIVGQGVRITTGRAFLLSFVYVLAMALTYAIAGVVAGAFGQNLQAAFQAPWVLILFSGVFVALALSMFGLYEIQLPSRWQTRLTKASEHQSRGTLHGVAVMGFLSAIIVGPCVAPPLAGALIYIGQSGDAALGGAALFSMALGMGTPLLAIGASAGRLLPKAGPWMETVKQVFGVIMLGLALWILERILPAPLTVFLWGVFLVGVAVFIGALDQLQVAVSSWRRLAKGLGLVLLIYGSVLIVAAAGGSSDVFRPLQTMEIAITGGAETSKLVFKPVKGLNTLEQELASARTQGRPVMLDLYADWCIECKRLDKETFSDQEVQRVLAQAILLKADVTDNDTADKELLRRLGLYGPPAVLFYGPDAEERRAYRLVGFLEPGAFYQHLTKVFANETG